MELWGLALCMDLLELLELWEQLGELVQWDNLKSSMELHGMQKQCSDNRKKAGNSNNYRRDKTLASKTKKKEKKI